MGAENNEYVRTVTRKALVAAVARVFNPGVKFDYVLTLVGAQGIRKSTFLHFLGGVWFSDSFTTVQGKESFEQLQGSWIIEIAELSGFKKAEVEIVKHFVSKSSDRFRVAYGCRNETFPRQCVFFGTTNELTFLKDHTGNRRFWPVIVTGMGNHLLHNMDIGQIWAEAKHYYDLGESLYLDDTEVAEQARLVQAGHSEVDERGGLVESYLNTKLPLGWPTMSLFERISWLSDPDTVKSEGKIAREKVCVAEIWCEVFKRPVGDMNNSNTKYIHHILNTLPEWKKSDNPLTFPLYGRQRAYTFVDVDIAEYV